MDMSKTIAPKSDQLNTDDLIGGPVVIKITRVTANEGSPEQPVSVFFEGDNGKPYRPCKSMRRVMVHIWGKDASQYAGRAMRLYRDPEVMFGGMKVGGIRISEMSHLEKPETMALTATRANRKPFTVRPLADDKSAPQQIDPEEAWAAAKAAAKKGRVEFVTWWNSDAGKATRPAVKDRMSELQRFCDDAEAEMANDPFDNQGGDLPTTEADGLSDNPTD